MENFETGKLISEIISANIENLYDATKKFVSDQSNKLSTRLKSTFSKYIESIERKYASTKTIIYRDTPQSIKLFYEPIDLFNDQMVLQRPTITDILKLKRPVIITGTGGSGKSTFLKYLLLNSIETRKHIPIFIELRNVEQEKTTLIEHIHMHLQLKKVELEESYLDLAFGHGNFLFLLDGFDELSPAYAQQIGDEIDHLTQSFEKCFFIVTSRPGQEFISWTNFVELKTRPLTLEKAVSLVERLNFDIEIKTNFIEELKKNLYNSHTSFFENPLLLSIMLITFRDSASIPSELHNFYSLAFEALYYRHDASKTFKRPTLTNLPVNKGKDIMSAFSLITYLKTQTSFNDYELKGFLNQALKLSNCECEVDELVTDLLKAYCMLLQDGTVYQYTHRSFQEYFAARFLVSTSEHHQVQLIKHFSKKADTDITLQLAYGMNPKLIEEKLFIPHLLEMRTILGEEKEITKDSFKKLAETYFDQVNVYRQHQPSLQVQKSEIGASEVLDKSQCLSVTRLMIKIFNINTKIMVNRNNRFSNKAILNVVSEGVPISEAFKDEKLLEWFTVHSVEAHVFRDLFKLLDNLMQKKSNNNELLNSLLRID